MLLYGLFPLPDAFRSSSPCGSFLLRHALLPLVLLLLDPVCPRRHLPLITAVWSSSSSGPISRTAAALHTVIPLIFQLLKLPKNFFEADLAMHIHPSLKHDVLEVLERSDGGVGGFVRAMMGAAAGMVSRDVGTTISLFLHRTFSLSCSDIAAILLFCIVLAPHLAGEANVLPCDSRP